MAGFIGAKAEFAVVPALFVVFLTACYFGLQECCRASSKGGKAQGVSTTMARVERATLRLFEKQYSCALKCR